MRAIGEFKDQEKAETFSTFLHAEGIDNEAEEEEGIWTIWVQDEANLERAARELERYRENPHRSVYLKAARQNDPKPIPKRSSRSRYKQVNLGRKWRDRNRVGSITLLLLLTSGVAFLLTGMGRDAANQWLQTLSITEYKIEGRHIYWMPGLPEIASMQSLEVWRLLTPAFIHFGPLHFLFNMVWLFDLGGMLENRKGPRFLVLFVLITGIAANLCQFYVSGPSFGGMSGVIYAFFGYAWMKGRFDPGDGIGLPPTTIAIMIGWFFLCLVQIVPGVANTAHGVGLAIGALWGYLSAVKWGR
tara:strand:- start:543 stop:1445 length:903 start_codon:yes stop_codon:yes gene_type:complete